MEFSGDLKKRTVMTTSGVILCAAAIGFFKCSCFGVDPFQCFAQGIWGHFFCREGILWILLYDTERHYAGSGFVYSQKMHGCGYSG